MTPLAASGFDEALLGLGMRTPQHEHHRLRQAGNGGQHRVREGFPSLTGMAGRLAFFDRQAGIEQQYTLAGPAQQGSTGRQGQPQIPLQLLEDIAQARRLPLLYFKKKGWL